MAVITINGIDYEGYADQAFAGEFLASDIGRAADWAAIADPDQEGRALATSSRMLAALAWENGAPAFDLVGIEAAAALSIQQATAMLAADLAADPDLASSLGSKREAKRVKAGAAEVEFFAPGIEKPLPLPLPIWNLVKGTGLIGSMAEAAHGVPVYTGGGVDTRFPDRDWTADGELAGGWH